MDRLIQVGGQDFRFIQGLLRSRLLPAKSLDRIRLLGGEIGLTDSEGRFIVEPGWSANRPIFVEDLMATMYSALGIDWTKSLTDTPSGRRFSYVVGAAEGDALRVNEVFG